MPRRLIHDLIIGTIKCRIVGKARLFAGDQEGYAAKVKLSYQHDALIGDIFLYGKAGALLEQSAKVLSCQIKAVCNIVERQLFGEVFVDIFYNIFPSGSP